MKREVNAALEFLLRLIKQRGTVDDSKAERFADKLRAILHERYAHHWYPANPSKGQAYRCIRVNRTQPCDESLLQACRETGLHPCELGLPRELTLWIDPGEISARSGEKCQHFTVAQFEEEGEGEREGGMEDAAQNPSPDQKPDCTEQQTSDYHSATSSDCSSDNEAGEKEQQEEEGGPSETPTAPTSQLQTQRATLFLSPGPCVAPVQEEGPPVAEHHVPAWGPPAGVLHPAPDPELHPHRAIHHPPSSAAAERGREGM
ncbi:maternal B9.15 protein, partial [Huso huso]